MTAPEVEIPDRRRRRPWVAVVFSLITPGLGHLYAGAPVRAAMFAVLPIVVAATMLLTSTRLAGRIQVVLWVAIPLSVLGFILWDAARTARRQASDYRPRWYNRWYIYAAIVITLSFVWDPLVTERMREHVARAHRLPSGAMEPTLLMGDYITSVPLRGPIERGHLVVFRLARGEYVKRVVGLPGDTLSMKEGTLLVDGQPLDEPYTMREPVDPVAPEFEWQKAHLAPTADSAQYLASVHNWGPLVVPADSYFVLGDNRSNSADSRYLGFIARDSIVAKGGIVYFSRNPETGEIRWNRIGRSAAR